PGREDEEGDEHDEDAAWRTPSVRGAHPVDAPGDRSWRRRTAPAPRIRRSSRASSAAEASPAVRTRRGTNTTRTRHGELLR
ncbi:hypothetical protein D9C01_13515, partial [Corynebacterium diphtheriae]